jgi:hypothetical protein
MFGALHLLCYNLYLLKALVFGTLHLWNSPKLPKALHEPNYVQTNHARGWNDINVYIISMQNELDQKTGIRHTTWSLAVTHKLVLSSSQNNIPNPPEMQSLFPLGRTDKQKPRIPKATPLLTLLSQPSDSTNDGLL